MRNLVFLLMIMTSNVFASDTSPLDELDFDLNTPSVQLKLDENFNNPEQILKSYKPVDAEIANKKVTSNSIEFDATKKVFGISKKAHVVGLIDIVRSDTICGKKMLGYVLSLDLTRSSSLVSDNVEKLEANLCFKVISDSKLTAHVKGLIYKTDSYDPLIGKIIRIFIEQQVQPLIDSLKVTVENQN